MKSLLAVTILLMSTAAIADQSVYIAADMRERIEMERILHARVPSLRIAKNAGDADFVLEMRRGTAARLMPSAPTRIEIPTAGWSGRGPTTGPMVSVPNPETPVRTSIIGSTVGIAHTKNGDVVIHSGLASPFFADQFARAFAEWLEAKN